MKKEIKGGFFMPAELTNIIFSVIGIVLTGLASWGTAVLIKWLNSKIK